jgi:hypothetical protein
MIKRWTPPDPVKAREERLEREKNTPSLEEQARKWTPEERAEKIKKHEADWEQLMFYYIDEMDEKDLQPYPK